MDIKIGATPKDICTGMYRIVFSWAFFLAIPQILSVINHWVLNATIVDPDGFDFTSDHVHLSSVHRFDAEGAKNAGKILHRDEWWRLITPIFLHGNPGHLAGNLVVQLRTGLMLEVLWGHTIWFIIYFVGGAMGTVWSCIFNPNILSVGSSGALCAVIGAWPVFIAITWNQVTPNDRKHRDKMFVFILLAISMLIGFSFMPLVDWSAHFGGLVTGMTLSATLFARKLQSPNWRLGVGIGGALATLALIGLSFAVLLTVIETDPILLTI